MAPFDKQPSLARAFSLFAAWDRQTATVAADELAQCLSGLGRSQRLHHSWRSSLLTGCRFPVEFAFSSLSDTAIRYCTEVDTVEVSPDTRLDRALTLLDKFDSPPFEQSVLTTFKQIQDNSNLRFGAWLGARYSKNSRQYKLYFDLGSPVDEQAKALLTQYLGQQPVLDEQLAKLVMIGKTPDSDGIEFYFEMHQPTITREQISQLLNRAGMNGRQNELNDMLDEARSYSSSLNKAGWPDSTYGFSLAVSAKGKVDVVTVFTFADHLIGGDGEIRKAVLSMAEKRHWQLPFYAQMSEPFCSQPYRYQYHNIIGFALTRNGNSGISISLAPPGELGEPPVLLQPNQTHVENAHPTDSADPALLLKQILAAQAPSGAFVSYVTLDDGKTVPDENAFVTAKVLRYLHTQTPTQALMDAQQRALDFLQGCEVADNPGGYSFWPHDAHPRWMGTNRLPADVDDTSVIACELYRYGRINLTQLQHSADSICRYRVERVNKTRYPWKHPDCLNTWMQHNYQPNLTDCIVNINALALLHQAQTAKGLCYYNSGATVNDGLAWAKDSLQRLMQLTPYYPNPTEMYFALKYATDQGVAELNDSFSAFRQCWQGTIMNNYRPDTPVYSREDGIILWTAPVLYQARKFFYRF